MNITELDSYNLEDAVKFHSQLNPKLWSTDENLLPEVRSKLLSIAEVFQEFLGLDDLKVKDITISGSNAAYSYTKNSDIDLHLVVEMPTDPVYQELFNAKKYEFNDIHNIRIRDIPVELYVQNAAEPPISQGEYSIKNSSWIQIPRRKKSQIDDTCVKAKVEDLDARIHLAIKSGSVDAMGQLWHKIKTMRKSGLEQHGEFGCENITYKLLRNSGCIQKLHNARLAAHDQALSLQERKKKKRKVKYGFGGYWYPGFAFGSESGDGGGESMREGHQGSSLSSEDGVAPSTQMFVNEADQDEHTVQRFIADTAKKLGIERLPKVYLHRDDDWAVDQNSFGMYQPETHELHVNLAGRHLMDILRTTAHELVHCRQHEISKMPPHAGNTGSPWENQAHAMAGVIMRNWADRHPESFDRGVMEASGYIPTKAQAQDSRFKTALTVDIRPGEVGRQANRLALKTDAKGQPALLMKTANLRESVAEDDLVTSLRAEFELLESEFIGEIKMSPKNLRAEAARTGALAGMEFEMIVPGVGISDDEELEPDYDYDTRSRSFSDIEEFFNDGDYNGRGDIRRLMEALGEDFMNWRMERISDDWSNEGEDYVRDYVANMDLFDRDEALATARDEIIDARPNLDTDSEKFQTILSARVNELEAEFADEQYQNRGRIYDEAYEEFQQEKLDDYDESDFLQETVPYMSDVASNYSISWPYYTTGGDGEVDVNRVADEFSAAIERPVNASTNYHGARREAGHYVVEPDGSLDPDDSDDAGLEFVSPPLPIDELLSDLKKVKAWADKNKCYTNKSTGLHINISVPGYSLDKLDYVKLALMMGDEYVLNQFGRSSNTYAKAAMGKIRDILRTRPEAGQQVLDKMRGHMEDLATKAIHTGSTDKYTSINTKDGYIEFRSPGGDWLDENFDKIENTLLRFTVAMAAAIDPNAYREEYLKKLYKLLEPTAGDGSQGDTIRYFADYVAGKMPRAALRSFVKQAQLQRKAAKGQAAAGQKYWWNVQWDANRRMEVVAGNKDVALQVAAEEWGVPESQLAGAKVTMLRPYEEPQAPAASQRASSMRPSNPDGNFVIMGSRQEPPAYRFMAADYGDADTVVLQWSREHPGEWEVIHDPDQQLGQPPVPGSTLDRQRQRAAAAQQSSYELYRISDGRTVTAPAGNPIVFQAQDPDDAESKIARYVSDFGLPGAAADYSVRSVIDNPSQSRNTVAPRTLTTPGLPQQQFTGTWIIQDPNGQELHRFSGIGNSQADANNFAVRWLRSNPQHLRAGVEVVPEMN